MRKTVTLREYFSSLNNLEESVDLVIDGTDTCIAVVGGEIRFTPAGEKDFKNCLDKMYVSGCCIFPKDDKEYSKYDEYLEKEDEITELDDVCLIRKTEILLLALAGYCSCADYDIWFDGENAKLI